MLATIEDNKWIWFSNITDHEEDVLWTNFSVSVPNIYIDPAQLGMWDGIYRKYNRAKRRMARPLLSLLRKVCSENDLPLNIKDKRGKPKYSPIDIEKITPDFLPGITLEQYQIRAIQAACRVECGLIDIPTGGGKGEVLCGICKAIQCPTIILADQTIVIDQIKARLELRDVDEQIGLFYAGRRPSGEMIVVGSIQSLTPPSKPPTMAKQKPDEDDDAYLKRLERWDTVFEGYKTRRKNSKYLQEYVKNAEMIIVDEADKATSDQYKLLFRNWFNGRRRYGTSGTLFDPSKPVENLVLQERLGSVIARETRQSLEKLGRIIPCKYYMLAFGIDGDIKESSAYDIAREEYIFANPTFHNTIAALCNKHKDDGTLILVDSINLGNALEDAINAIGIEAHFIYGNTPKKTRNIQLRAFEGRKYPVLIGGKIINRGLDLAGGCDNLILATGGKLRSDFVQKIGRALRNNKRGYSRIYHFYFMCNKYLYAHSKERLKIIVSLDYDASVVFPGGVISGEDLIKRRFVVPKKFFKRVKMLY